jgi:AbiV family abortive infection protein
MPKETLLTGAKLSYKNAQGLVDCADASAQRLFYGPANSLLILAGEECIKSIVLLALAFNVETPLRIDKIFRYHGTKHDIALEIEPVIKKLSVFANMVHLIFSGKSTSRDKAFQLVFSLFLDAVIAKLKPKDNPGISDFWRTANDRKNAGLYVDATSAGWHTPQQIEKKEYDATLSQVNVFLDLIKVVDAITIKDCIELDAQKIKDGIPIPGPFTLLDPNKYEVLE